MADASFETLGAPSSSTRITYLDYKNCPEKQRRRKLRFQCAFFHLFFQIQVPDCSVTDKINLGVWPKDFPDP